MNEFFQNAHDAKYHLQNLSNSIIKNILVAYANELIKNIDFILSENKKDLDRMDKNNPKYDRLLLNKDRLKLMSSDIKKVAKYKFSPFHTIEKRRGANGIKIEKRTTPFGVIGIIYESRPNVTTDSISLFAKTKNVCILKGSSDAIFSNKALVQLYHQILDKNGLNKNFVTLLDTNRESTLELISAKNFVDLCIPRGGKELIKFVSENATVPVIETGAGVVHIYVDDITNIKLAQEIILNSKTRRPSVCNTLDCLLVSEKMLLQIYDICKPLLDYGVKIFADKKSFDILNSHNAINIEKATDDSFGTEFLSLTMSIKTVKDLNDAISFINGVSSKHTECIITDNKKHAEIFLQNIDSAVVMHNTSTGFTDGSAFDMISEIGISTQKIHARGPFALNELLTYKWIVTSNGSIRS